MQKTHYKLIRKWHNVIYKAMITIFMFIVNRCKIVCFIYEYLYN